MPLPIKDWYYFGLLSVGGCVGWCDNLPMIYYCPHIQHPSSNIPTWNDDYYHRCAPRLQYTLLLPLIYMLIPHHINHLLWCNVVQRWSIPSSYYHLITNKYSIYQWLLPPLPLSPISSDNALLLLIYSIEAPSYYLYLLSNCVVDGHCQ